MTRIGPLLRPLVQFGRIHVLTARCGLHGSFHMLMVHMTMLVHFVLGQDGRRVSRQKCNQGHKAGLG